MQFKTEVGKSFGLTTQIKDLTIVSKPSYLYLTSSIYPTEVIEKLYTETINLNGRSNTSDDLGIYKFNQDNSRANITSITGTLKVALIVYNYFRTEEDIDKLDVGVSNITAILREVLLNYSIKEDNLISSVSSISGVLRTVLIAYNFYKIENINSTISNLDMIYTSVQNSYEIFIKGNNDVYKYPALMNRMLFRATTQSLLSEELTELNNHDLVFSEAYSEVNSKNVIMIFGAKSIPKEPEVIVNEYTTAALDFEDGLIDKIPTTIWTAQGTGNVQSVNKIYGKNSFETKVLGDALITNTDTITGNTTPFNIEFYALLKTGTEGYFPLLYKNYSGGMGEQGFFVDTLGYLNYHVYRNQWLGISSSLKIKPNEINKYNITYDGAAIRVLFNNKLELVLGSPYGLENIQHREPLSFFKQLVPGYESYSKYTTGLIDNINIFNNIAGPTRTINGYEDYLEVDLSFDGENGSTKIIDNGNKKINWSVIGNAGISTNVSLGGYSSLLLDGNNDYLVTNSTPNDSFNFDSDFTINYKFLSNNKNKRQVIIDKYNNLNGQWQTSLNTDGRIYFTYDNPYKFFQTNITNLNNGVEHEINIIKQENILLIYVDSILDSTFNITGISFSQTSNVFVAIGAQVNNRNSNYDFDGYIKDIKIYKGISLIPESNANKIQLNFDNNFLDTYRNSAWSGSSITFNQVNSVRSYSAYFTGTGHNLTSNSLNINLSDFIFSTDIIFNSGNTYKVLLNIIDSVYFYYHVGNKTFLLETYNDGTYLSGTSTKAISLDFFKFYNIRLHVKANKGYIFINHQLVDVIQLTLPNAVNVSRVLRIGRPASNTSYFLDGYMDNLNIVTNNTNDLSKDYIGRPSVHLPLETNKVNIGTNEISIAEVSSPTYQMFNGKKCIKFESGKYLTVSQNNAFTLGNNSDFYFEVDYYINNWLPNSGDNNNRVCLLTTSDASIFSFRINQTTLKLEIIVNGISYILNSTIFELNKFYNIKIYRKNNTTYSSVNNKTETTDTVFNIQTNNLQINIGGTNSYSNTSSDGYMSNFKLFVGTSEIPSTYNDKKVLNLDFKPTRESYLFKDNNNKCLVDTQNITQRDYQDSKYCCYFNGDNQALKLGKNTLFDFGNDDFIIEIVFKKETSSGWRMLLCDNADSKNFIDIGDTNFLAVKMGGFRYDTPPNSIENGVITKVLLQVSNSVLTVKINGEQVTLDNQPTRVVTNVNFNLGDNTFIGKYYTNTEYFKGYIYSLKVLRNTTDLTLLEDEDSGEVGDPIKLTLQTMPNQVNPEPGSYVNVTGRISYSLSLPSVSAKLNNVSIPTSNITLSERANGDYDLLIRLLSDDLESTNIVDVTVTDTVYTDTGSVSFSVIYDKNLDLNSLDSFGTYWEQSNVNDKVTIREIDNEEMMYFSGNSALYSNNYSVFLGLDKFTIELDFMLTSNPVSNGYFLISQGLIYNTLNLYHVCINSDLSITFFTNKSSPNSLENLKTNVGVVSLNTKYRLAITRDENYNVRIFLNGTNIAERVIKTNLGYTQDIAINNTTYMLLGREGSRYNDNNNTHFRGYMKNISIRKGECLYTNNYTPEDYTRGILTKSLLTFNESNGSFVTKEDSFNRDITWNNTGGTVLNNELVFNNSQNRLTSSSNSMYNFGINNWTIDLIFTTTQILTEAVLLDLRTSSNSFNGILVRQSSSDPTSITISFGNSTATQAYTFSLTTGVNSIKANVQNKLKIVRSRDYIIVFLNDLEVARNNTVNTMSFTTNTSVCLGNDLSYTKGFNGRIKQFRIINGTATNVYALPIKSGEILT